MSTVFNDYPKKYSDGELSSDAIEKYELYDSRISAVESASNTPPLYDFFNKIPSPDYGNVQGINAVLPYNTTLIPSSSYATQLNTGLVEFFLPKYEVTVDAFVFVQDIGGMRPGWVGIFEWDPTKPGDTGYGSIGTCLATNSVTSVYSIGHVAYPFAIPIGSSVTLSPGTVYALCTYVNAPSGDGFKVKSFNPIPDGMASINVGVPFTTVSKATIDANHRMFSCSSPPVIDNVYASKYFSTMLRPVV